MSEKEILIRTAIVGGVLFTVCLLYVIGGIVGALILALLAEATFRQIEHARALQPVPSDDHDEG